MTDKLYSMKTAEGTIRIEQSPTHGFIRVMGKHGVTFTIQPRRGLDITSLFYNGVAIGYNAPDEIPRGKEISYETGAFAKNLFLGMLTTCGLENTGPEQMDKDGTLWLQHGSQNLSEVTNLQMQEENGVLEVSGDFPSSFFGKHQFFCHRTIRFIDEDCSISVQDSIRNNGPKDQICVMYHYNLGQPFLDSCCELEIPFLTAIPKNEDAVSRQSWMMSVCPPTQGEKPHVFFMDFPQEQVNVASIRNPNLNLELRLTARNQTLPKMDLWKNLTPEKYVLSLEPCNSFPYGRLKQLESETACYLESGETIEYSTQMTIRRYK